MRDLTLPFSKISMEQSSEVGGKNASLGEMFQKLTPKGIQVPDGFAVTAEAYRQFLQHNQLEEPLKEVLSQLDTEDFSNLSEIGEKARKLIREARLHEDLKEAILQAFHELKAQLGEELSVAVRSSATAEDLPEASFAGQLESFLNVSTDEGLLEACLQCYESLFTDRVIKYREDNNFPHMEVYLSVGVQQMVRSDKASAGVGFTIEPDSGFPDVIVLNGSWGLGENVVKGRVAPDEFVVFKPTLKSKKKSIISKKLGAKEHTLEYAEDTGQGETTKNFPTPVDKRKQFVLNDEEVEQLALWSLQIEEHYDMPMDIEWAKDGLSGDLFIVQARPETVYGREKDQHFTIYKLKEKGQVLASGNGLGNKITAGKARILNHPSESGKLQKGEVLVTDITDPDWDPILKKAAAIITNKGGRTSHAAIVAREQGAVAVVGTGNATENIQDGKVVTVSSAEGKTGFVYDGQLEWEESQVDMEDVQLPQTEVMLILGDPEKAFQLAMLPNNGIGLMRLEFIIANAIQTHPMALIKFDELKDEDAKKKIKDLTYGYDTKSHYFIDRLAQAVATIAAAFYPKDVIVRMSDFKSNEYANLIGGRQFEPEEENPMLGFRGASRYDHELYREGFRLECEAMKVVRQEMGLTNVKLMIPFCRTVEEGRQVLDLMAGYGLPSGENGLEIYTMIEIPSNVILADEFAEIFDGFSVGTNDLTQLVLGLDRDNSLISELFDENNEAVKRFLAQVIQTARRHQIKIGLCGQAPSDFPEFAQFLVKEGIDSISFNADALFEGIKNINEAEKEIKERGKKETIK